MAGVYVTALSFSFFRDLLHNRRFPPSPNPLSRSLCVYRRPCPPHSQTNSTRQIPSCSTHYRNDMSGARGCFNCGGCALLFLRRLLHPLARSRLLFLESASDTGSNFLAAFCSHSLAPLSPAIRRTSPALVHRMRLLSRFCEIYPVSPSSTPQLPVVTLGAIA